MYSQELGMHTIIGLDDSIYREVASDSTLRSDWNTVARADAGSTGELISHIEQCGRLESKAL